MEQVYWVVCPGEARNTGFDSAIWYYIYIYIHTCLHDLSCGLGFDQAFSRVNINLWIFGGEICFQVIGRGARDLQSLYECRQSLLRHRICSTCFGGAQQQCMTPTCPSHSQRALGQPWRGCVRSLRLSSLQPPNRPRMDRQWKSAKWTGDFADCSGQVSRGSYPGAGAPKCAQIAA